jgi:branched-chain amino acid transport system permease protein
VLGFATLSDVVWTTSGAVVLMTLVGGMGTMLGPILGAAIIVSLESKVGDLGTWLMQVTGIEWFGRLGESVTIVTGLIFVLCVSLFRAGIVGELEALAQRLAVKRSAARAASTTQSSA